LQGNNFASNGDTCSNASCPGNAWTDITSLNPGDVVTNGWQFTVPTGDAGTLFVTDGGHEGDIFNIYSGGTLNVTNGPPHGALTGTLTGGTLIGTTSTPVYNPNGVHSGTQPNCGPIGPVPTTGGPNTCAMMTDFSHASITLGPGSYALNFQETNFFEDSFLAWFNVKLAPASTPPASTVPETGTFVLMGSALIAVSFIRRWRS
jgi:hypothetical protein